MASIEFAGQTFELSPTGSLYWPLKDTLIVSDLHLEKASSFLPSGLLLPPYDTAATLEKLQQTCERYQPKRILFLGDIFHDGDALQRMSNTNRELFDKILDRHETVWVEGNHDGGCVPNRFQLLDTYTQCNIHFNHIAQRDLSPEISGHYHPCVRFSHKGQKIKRPCFAVNERKLILPSFGSLTGGLSVETAAIKTAMEAPFKKFVLGSDSVYHLKR